MTMLLRIALCALLLLTNLTCQTPVSGSVSGTWNAAGSPYLVAADVTVPHGQTLSIEAGSEIRFFAGTSIYVDGQILARGTAARRILFVELVTAQPWGTISVRARSNTPPQSSFEFCDFRGAASAVHAYARGVNAGWTNLTVTIADCSFDACTNGFVGEALGWNHYIVGTPSRRHGRLLPIIERCRFENLDVAISLNCFGSCNVWCGSADVGIAVRSNQFRAVATVMQMAQNATASGTFAGNTVIDCDYGVRAGADFAVDIANNIFADCETALDVTTNSAVHYNAFHNNTTACSGCLVSFGAAVWTNRNNHPCDLGFNIFADPLFVDPTQHDYRLAAGSPALEAGHPTTAITGLDTHSDPRNLDADGDGVAWSDLGFDEFNVVDYSVSGPATVGSSLTHQVDAPPGWAFFVAAAFLPGDTPAGGLGAILLSGPIVLFANGAAPGSVTSSIPNLPQFVGLDIFFQAAAVSPALVPASLSRRIAVRLH
ncbi:MAG: hypothetical protein NXI31_26315 [bacterium]|nr:hypothetical protein [bacterium]